MMLASTVAGEAAAANIIRDLLKHDDVVKLPREEPRPIAPPVTASDGDENDPEREAIKAKRVEARKRKQEEAALRREQSARDRGRDLTAIGVFLHAMSKRANVLIAHRWCDSPRRERLAHRPPRRSIDRLYGSRSSTNVTGGRHAQSRRDGWPHAIATRISATVSTLAFLREALGWNPPRSSATAPRRRRRP